MNNNFRLRKQIDLSLFEMPVSRAKAFLNLFKYSMNSVKISPDSAEIFVCNKSSYLDKDFISGSISTPHVFLKDEVILKLYNDEYSKDKIKTISDKILELLNQNVSIVIFPEKFRTIFGDYEVIPEKITSFIQSFEKNVSFFSLINTFFIKPVWAAEENKCETKLEQRFHLTHTSAKKLSSEEYNEKFNGFMPSSASTYTLKYPLFLKGKRPAENIESIIYACPNCKKLFTLYSEYSCVKCEDCGTAFELSETGELALAKHFDSFDSAKVFQKFILKQYDFGSKLIIGYKNIIVFDGEELNKKTASLANLCIYKDKFELKSDGKTKTIKLGEVLDFELLEDNILRIYLKDKSKLLIQGKNKENFYILFDLLENFRD